MTSGTLTDAAIGTPSAQPRETFCSKVGQKGARSFRIGCALGPDRPTPRGGNGF